MKNRITVQEIAAEILWYERQSARRQAQAAIRLRYEEINAGVVETHCTIEIVKVDVPEKLRDRRCKALLKQQGWAQVLEYYNSDDEIENIFTETGKKFLVSSLSPQQEKELLQDLQAIANDY